MIINIIKCAYNITICVKILHNRKKNTESVASRFIYGTI